MRLFISTSQVLIRGLFLIFNIALYRAAFCCVLARVCEGKPRLCLKFGKRHKMFSWPGSKTFFNSILWGPNRLVMNLKKN